MWDEKWYRQERKIEKRKGVYNMRDEKKGFAIRGDTTGFLTRDVWI